MTDWQPIETAPKDGTEVWLPLEIQVRAFWCDDLKRWVLSRPLSMESFIQEPTRWKPGPPQ